MKSQELEQFKLPDTPGVYFFREGEKILYIGKATSLRSRVRSYFAGDLIHTRGPGIVDMVFKSDKVTFEETDSVLEALILEANLIKKFKPHYNVKEKDDKSWNYVCITKESFPKVIIERQKNINFETLQTLPFGRQATSYQLQTLFGPYTEGGSLREALKIIRRIFPYIDPASAKRDNYEFYRQLGLTPDVTRDEAQEAYRKNITNIKRFFSGKKKEILRELERDMKDAAKSEEFERAVKIRNQIFALTHINDVALLKRDSLPTTNYQLQTSYRIEAYDVAHTGGQNTVGVMVVLENGEPNKKEYRTFTIRQPKGGSDTDALAELVGRRLRHARPTERSQSFGRVEWGLPDLVVTDGGEGQKRVAERMLKGYQLEIPVVSVVKDSAHKPKDILGDKNIGITHKDAILLANSEAHRFSLRLHKAKRGKSFLGK